MQPLLHPFTLLIAFLYIAPVLSWDLSSITALRKRLPRGLVDTPHIRKEEEQERFKENYRLQEWLQSQQPPLPHGAAVPQIIMPGNDNPPSSDGGNRNDNGNNPVLADVLPRTRGINIFASLTRDFSSVESRLSDTRHNVTVLAPRNSAIQDLPRKPWENPDDYARFGEAAAYEGEDGQDRAKQNLRKFVEAHVVPVSPWGEGQEVETLGGEKVRWRKEGEKILIQPGDVEVESVAEKVSNGEVWVLNGVVNYR